MGIELARGYIDSILGIEIPKGSDRNEPMVLCSLTKIAKKRRMWVSLEMIEQVVPDMYVRYRNRKEGNPIMRKGGYPTPPKVGHEEAHIISKFHKYTVRTHATKKLFGEVEALKNTENEKEVNETSSLAISASLYSGEETVELQTGKENEIEKEMMDTPSTITRMTPEDAMAGILEETAGDEEGATVAAVGGDTMRVEELLGCYDEEMPCTPLSRDTGMKVRMFG